MGHVKKCTKCGAESADVREDPHAWDGWQILPTSICHGCIKKVLDAREAAAEKAKAQGRKLATARR